MGWLWSRVRPNENSAQPVVRVFGNLLRVTSAVVILVGILFGIGVTLFGRTDRFMESEREKISVFVAANRHGCDGNTPIAVTAENRSLNALTSMQLELEVRHPGRSTNLLSPVDRRIDWDFIVPPAHGYTSCYSGGGAYDPSMSVWARVDRRSIHLEAASTSMLRETVATPLPD